MIKYCFSCQDLILDQNHSSFRVREDFCHPSYWKDDGRQYGRLEDGTGFGILYLHQKCDASEAHGNPLGEEYEHCEGCDTVFHSDDLSIEIYKRSGETLCPYCARDYVLEHLDEFANEGLPDFNKPLPSINLAGMGLDHPRLREAPEDIQGWAASMSVPRNDRGYGTYRDAIKAVVDRGNRWIVAIGGPSVTHNICAVSVTVHEVLDGPPAKNSKKYCTGFRCWSCEREGRYTAILREQTELDRIAHEQGTPAWYTDDRGKPMPCPVCGAVGEIEGEPHGFGIPGVYRSPEEFEGLQRVAKRIAGG